MSVGFAMRFGDFPPAVSLPPAPVVVDRRTPVIEAQIVRENTTVSNGNKLAYNSFPRGMQGNRYFQKEAPVYTSRGTSGHPLDGSGLRLDLFG